MSTEADLGGPLLTDLPERVTVLEEIADARSRIIYEPSAAGGFVMREDFREQRARHEADMAPLLARIAEAKVELERQREEMRTRVLDHAIAEAVERAGVPQPVAEAVRAYIKQTVPLRVEGDDRVVVDDARSWADLDFAVGSFLESDEGKALGPDGRFGMRARADGPLTKALRARLEH